MQRLLRVVLVLGMAGTLAELILLEHTDDYWQKLPLALLAAGIVVVVGHGFSPGRLTRMIVAVCMVLFLAAGSIGLYQHVAGNREFELEINASRHGWELTWDTLKGATPALAPGTLIYLGLLGLACIKAERAASRLVPRTPIRRKN